MDKINIEVGESGFSLCHAGHLVVGECIIEGVQEIGVAQELSEMLSGELEETSPITPESLC
ncbi:MAG: hypothetical protein HQL67_03400 [Magnetococcales bacterium]|nr:hypothetical protein [Magnetococcales bacterium]